MKAVRCTKYGPADVLEIQEITKPVPKDFDVLVKIIEAVVTATDCTMRLGKPFISRFFTGLSGPKYIPGDLLSGIVEAVGKDVTRVKPGDAVFGFTDTTFGAHAEYRCLPESNLSLKLDAITHGEAAAICDGGLTALPFLRDTGKIKPGQKVLINGAAGGVGTAAVQLAKYFGTEVTAVCSRANAGLVRSLGADRVVDYTKEDFTREGIQYDIIFDAVAKNSFSRCKKALSQRGRYLTTAPSFGVMFWIIWTKFFSRKKAKMAATGLRKPAAKIQDLEFLKERVEEGSFRSVVDRRFIIDEIVEAHRYVETGHKRGNVVLTINAS